MFKIFKNKVYVLFFVFFFSLVSTMYVYGSPYGYSAKADAKSKITSDAQYALISKCKDRSTDMKEIAKSYKVYKEALKISTKADMVSAKSWYDDFKEDFYEDMSLEQQKDMESAYVAFIKAKKVYNKTLNAISSAAYKLAKVDRSYYKVKKSVADYKIEKAKKHYDKMKESLNVAVAELNVASSLLLSKREVICAGDNIFTRAKNLWEESK